MKKYFYRYFTLDSKMRCPYCDKDQYITQKSKLKTFFFNMIVLLPLVLNLIFNIPGVILLSLFPILFIIVMLIHPFHMEIGNRSEEHTSELQSRGHLVCRLLLDKQK